MDGALSVWNNSVMAKLYDRVEWKRLRLEQLRAAPFCAFCNAQGHLVPATVVDHRIPHRGDEALFFDRGNLQSLCKRCHDGAKQALEKSGTLRGGDSNGIPLDPAHPWHRS